MFFTQSHIWEESLALLWGSNSRLTVSEDLDLFPLWQEKPADAEHVSCVYALGEAGGCVGGLNRTYEQTTHGALRSRRLKTRSNNVSFKSRTARLAVRRCFHRLHFVPFGRRKVKTWQQIPRRWQFEAVKSIVLTAIKSNLLAGSEKCPLAFIQDGWFSVCARRKFRTS